MPDRNRMTKFEQKRLVPIETREMKKLFTGSIGEGSWRLRIMKKNSSGLIKSVSLFLVIFTTIILVAGIALPVNAANTTPIITATTATPTALRTPNRPGALSLPVSAVIRLKDLRRSVSSLPTRQPGVPTHGAGRLATAQPVISRARYTPISTREHTA